MKKCSGLNQERNLHQIKQRLQDKTALNKYVAGFWCERQQQMHFFTGGRVIMDYGLYGIWVKNILMMDVFHLLSSPDVNWWTGVVWIIVMFLSDSHSDGTHSLQSIHCWDTDAVMHFYKPDEETNSSWSRMTSEWVYSQIMFILTNKLLYLNFFTTFTMDTVWDYSEIASKFHK